MNVTVENLAPCRKLLRVEVDPAAVEQAFEEITTDYQRQAKIAGFRPGKAPRDRVLKNYQKEIEEQTKSKLLKENYRKALEEQKIDVISCLDIEEVQFVRGQPLQFTATIETAPEFELPEYKGLRVQRETRTVTDEDVEQALNVLRQQRMTYVDVPRPVQTGDFVVVNYSGTCEGKPLTEIAPTAKGLTKQQAFWMHIRPDSFIPGFTEQLVGHNAGDKLMVTVQFPEGFIAGALAGKTGEYEVEIVTVKVQAVPELNDAFAKSFEAADLEKLRSGVRKDLENELEFKKRRELRNQLVGLLLDRVNFELPESMVLSETRNVVYDIVRENQERGLSKEIIDQQKDEIYQVANNSAKGRVKASFVLSRIAQKEGIKVTEEEMRRRIAILSHQHQIPVQKLVRQLEEKNGLAEIHQQILTTKVLEFLEREAQIEDISPQSTQTEPAAPPAS